MTLRGMYRTIWILAAAAILVMTVLFARQPPALLSPGPLVPYTTGDKSLSLQHPDNWKPHETSEQAVKTQVEFTSIEGARIVVISDLQGSLMADISRANNSTLDSLPGMPTPSHSSQKSPLEVVHEQQGQRMGENTKGYPGFEDGATHRAEIDKHAALATDFTFTSDSGDPMVGRRMTALSTDRRIAVVYTSPKVLWKQLSPIFEKMVASIHVSQ